MDLLAFYVNLLMKAQAFIAKYEENNDFLLDALLDKDVHC
jgi:hypothetical protein